MLAHIRQTLSALDWWLLVLTGVLLIAVVLAGLFAARTIGAGSAMSASNGG